MTSSPCKDAVIGAILVVLVTFAVDDVKGQDCTNEGGPYLLNCADTVSTLQFFPNVFFGLNPSTGDYIPLPGGSTTSYMPSVGFPNSGGIRFPPGNTPVTFTATNACDSASCTFNVFNPLTELPVQCPDFTDTQPTDTGRATHTFTAPSFGPSDVQVSSAVDGYFYHGGSPRVTISVPGEPNLGVGTHTITTVIEDDVLNRTCTSTITVIDEEDPTITCQNIVSADTNLSPGTACTINDNADPSVNVTFSENGPFPLGSTDITVTATDASGNSATAQFTVTIRATTTSPTAGTTAATTTTTVGIPSEPSSGSSSSEEDGGSTSDDDR